MKSNCAEGVVVHHGPVQVQLGQLAEVPEKVDVVHGRQIDAVGHFQADQVLAPGGHQLHGHVDATVDVDGVVGDLGLNDLVQEVLQAGPLGVNGLAQVLQQRGGPRDEGARVRLVGVALDDPGEVLAALGHSIAQHLQVEHHTVHAALSQGFGTWLARHFLFLSLIFGTCSKNLLSFSEMSRK